MPTPEPQRAEPCRLCSHRSTVQRLYPGPMATISQKHLCPECGAREYQLVLRKILQTSGPVADLANIAGLRCTACGHIRSDIWWVTARCTTCHDKHPWEVAPPLARLTYGYPLMRQVPVSTEIPDGWHIQALEHESALAVLRRDGPGRLPASFQHLPVRGSEERYAATVKVDIESKNGSLGRSGHELLCPRGHRVHVSRKRILRLADSARDRHEHDIFV